jgi:hypothetical protein
MFQKLKAKVSEVFIVPGKAIFEGETFGEATDNSET